MGEQRSCRCVLSVAWCPRVWFERPSPRHTWRSRGEGRSRAASDAALSASRESSATTILVVRVWHSVRRPTRTITAACHPRLTVSVCPATRVSTAACWPGLAIVCPQRAARSPTSRSSSRALHIRAHRSRPVSRAAVMSRRHADSGSQRPASLTSALRTAHCASPTTARAAAARCHQILRARSRAGRRGRPARSTRPRTRRPRGTRCSTS